MCYDNVTTNIFDHDPFGDRRYYTIIDCLHFIVPNRLPRGKHDFPTTYLAFKI